MAAICREVSFLGLTPTGPENRGVPSAEN